MRYLEVRKTYLHCLYRLQFCCKAWPSVRVPYHHDQILTRLFQSSDMMSVVAYSHRIATTSECKVVPRCLKFRKVTCPYNLNLTQGIPLNPTATIHHTYIFQAYDLWFLNILLLWNRVTISFALTMFGIHFLNIGLAPKNPYLSLKRFYHYEPLKYTKLFRDKGPCLILVRQCYSYSRKGSPYWHKYLVTKKC